MENENIQIKTYIEIINNHQIFPIKEINGKKKIFEYEKDLLMSNISDKDGYTLIIFHKTLTIDNNFIKYLKLIVRIIKWLPDNKILEKDLEIKHEKIISLKEFNLNFLYFDIFKINDEHAFLFVFLFNQFYFFKIYEKEENMIYSLVYEKLNVDTKDIYINEEDPKNTYLFVGNSIYNESILEYAFIQKPKNYFVYLMFNFSSLDKINKELDYKIIKRSLDRNISEKFKLKKFWRGLNNDKFVFIEDKSLQMILKDNNDESKMLSYPFEINYDNRKIFPDKVPFLIKILDKMYIIIDISKLEVLCLFYYKSNNI